MPRYQLDAVVVLSAEEDLLAVVLDPDVKKPSANLPFLETSLSTAWPAVRVWTSFAVASQHLLAVLCRETRRKSTNCM
jgi:hypothetical protein